MWQNRLARAKSQDWHPSWCEGSTSDAVKMAEKAGNGAGGSWAFQPGGLARSPPGGRERLYSADRVTPFLSLSNSEKRKREESSAKIFAEMLQRLLEGARELQKMTEEYGNTKRELKEAAKAMVRRTLDVEFQWEAVEQELAQTKEQTKGTLRPDGERVKQAIK